MSARRSSDPPGGTARDDTPNSSRLPIVVAVFVVAIVGVSTVGAFSHGDLLAMCYDISLWASALLLIGAAQLQPRDRRAPWTWIGVGALFWAAGATVNTLLYDLHVESIPAIVPMLLYALGYLPIVIGLAELADPRLHTRRLSGIADGVLVFLSLYAVLWLLVVEKFAYATELPKLDRAFQSLYPAGDLAMVVLTARVIAGRIFHRHTSWTLFVAALGGAGCDIALLSAYLVNPEGEYRIINFAYQLSVAALALAALLALSPSPPVMTGRARASGRLTMLVALSSLVPPVVLLLLVVAGHRELQVEPVALWLMMAAVMVVLRNLAGQRELERAHQQAMWLASHDHDTDLLRRAPFLHEVSEGDLRDRTGTVMVIEIGGLASIGDRLGHDAADHAAVIVAERVQSSVGAAVVARMAHEQFAVFMRSTTLGRGRQVAAALQAALAEPVVLGTHSIALEFSIGVAQADGAVIDVLAGVRRATDAMRHARRMGPGHVSVDADLTGTVLASSAQSTAGPKWSPTPHRERDPQR